MDAGWAGMNVAITATLYNGFRKRIRVANLAVGALLWWLLSAVLMGALFPPESFMYTWPLFFSLLGLGALFALGDRSVNPWYPFAALALGGIPAAMRVMMARTRIAGQLVPILPSRNMEETVSDSTSAWGSTSWPATRARSRISSFGAIHSPSSPSSTRPETSCASALSWSGGELPCNVR
jgi:hypothetical protein